MGSYRMEQCGGDDVALPGEFSSILSSLLFCVCFVFLFLKGEKKARAGINNSAKTFIYRILQDAELSQQNGTDGPRRQVRLGWAG